MSDYSVLNRLLQETVINSKGKIVNDEFNIRGLSFIKLRDILYSIGKIVSENISDKIYIATVQSGFLKMSSVVLVIQLADDKLLIAAYSMGIINRKKVCKGAINEFRKKIKQFIK